MKSVNVVGAILFNNRDDTLTHAGKNRSDHNRRHDANHNAEHGQEAAKLVRAHVVERHGQSFAGKDSWQLYLHLIKNCHRGTETQRRKLKGKTKLGFLSHRNLCTCAAKLFWSTQ